MTNIHKNMSISARLPELSTLVNWDNISFESHFVNPQHLVLPQSVIVSFRRLKLHEYVRTRALHHRCFLKIHLAGKGVAGVDHNLFCLKENDGILIFPFQLHYIEQNGSDQEQFQLLVEFALSPDDLNRIEEMRNHPFHLNDQDISRLNLIIQGTLGVNDISHEQVVYVIAEFLSEKSRTMKNDEKTLSPLPDPSIYPKVFRYIMDNFHKEISIKTICNEFNISDSKLRKLFHNRLNGMTLGKLLNNLKLRKAIELLTYSNLSISEISQACGYNDPFTFSKAFKRSIGLPPREYCNQYRNMDRFS